MKPPSPLFGAEASSLPPTFTVPLCMSPSSLIVPLWFSIVCAWITPVSFTALCSTVPAAKMRRSILCAVRSQTAEFFLMQARRRDVENDHVPAKSARCCRFRRSRQFGASAAPTIDAGKARVAISGRC